jgi:hypothetical protein
LIREGRERRVLNPDGTVTHRPGLNVHESETLVNPVYSVSHDLCIVEMVREWTPESHMSSSAKNPVENAHRTNATGFGNEFVLPIGMVRHIRPPRYLGRP